VRVGSHDGATSDRIIDAFLELAADRGIKATTTRQIAEAAHVNEVTLFRQFGDKETLAREAMRRRMPRLPKAFDGIDASSIESSIAGVTERVKWLRDLMVSNAELLELAISISRRQPKLAAGIRELPRSVPRAIEAALREARRHLRRNVDLEAAALSLTGLVLLTVLWQRREFLRLSKPRWNALLEAAVTPLFKEVSQ
jgi:AcrR family transcriptional regulator